ncbi:MAG: hypothetical protein EON52_24230 [Actinomycetales bacterium]|nr:MAG: hypothetical protein EON52_24230 [Actinomycetales bacterium]
MRRLASVLVLVLLLTACGGSSEKKADEKAEPFAGQDLSTVLSQARRAALDSPFLTVRGEGNLDSGRFSLNLFYVGDTTSGYVGNTFGTLSLLRVDGDDYASPGNGFFYEELEERALELEDEVDGRWIALGTDNKNLFLHRAQLLRSSLKPAGALRRGKAKMLYGVECVALEHEGGTIYVSPKDNRPLQVIDGEGNVVNFEYDRHEKPTPPEPDEVVDPRELTAFGSLKV